MTQFIRKRLGLIRNVGLFATSAVLIVLIVWAARQEQAQGMYPEPSEDTLTLALTRASGQVVHQYHLQAAPGGRLVRLQQHLNPMPGQVDEERLLVNRVDQFSCRTIGEDEVRLLEVTIGSIDGLQAQRSWQWP